MRHVPARRPQGYATVNPFIITEDAEGLFAFVMEVFGGTERVEARTADHDGLLLHAEVEIAGSSILVADRKPGWPVTPSLIQVYVADVPATLEVAERLGGEVVTRPTDFFGEVFSRVLDPWGNLWWIYSPAPADAKVDWEAAGEGDGEQDWSAEDPGLAYIHRTLLEAMPRVGSRS